MDQSVNGIYYLGNRIENKFVKQKSARLKQGINYKLKNGDLFGILMKKETANKDMIVGYEFTEVN